ncbi:IS66 family insertion sequence element accessory protein TnpA [Endozoicomonas lisbonensis]|uniref:Transposase n=1 Tax=Endozoicomonas lisbonensis TaxID=3120522 RepID=A0ABV2SCB9_9GAMM
MKPEERKQNQALWQERMNDWQQSGLSASGWCKKHDIKQHLFFYWKHKLLTRPDNKLIPLGVVQPEPSAPSLVILYMDSIRIEAAPEQAAALIKALQAAS